MIDFQRLHLSDDLNPLLLELIRLSQQWADEKTCPSYSANDAQDFLNHDLFLAFDDDALVAYAMGDRKELTITTGYNEEGELAFELDELYVLPSYRQQGLGKDLYQYLEDSVRQEVDVLKVTATSYRYQDLLRFYVDDLGLEFRYAFLVKRL